MKNVMKATFMFENERSKTVKGFVSILSMKWEEKVRCQKMCAKWYVGQ